eukprot:g61514.t1
MNFYLRFHPLQENFVLHYLAFFVTSTAPRNILGLACFRTLRYVSIDRDLTLANFGQPTQNMAEAEGTIQETEEEQEVLSLSTEEVAQLLPFLTAQLHGFQTSEERSGRDQPLSPDRHLEAVQACLGAAFQNFLLTDLHRVQGRVDVFEMPLL